MGIFGIKRQRSDMDKREKAQLSTKGQVRLSQPVKKLRRKQELEALKERRDEAEAKKKRAELERKRQVILAEKSLYEARAGRKKAKRAAGFQWPILPTAKVKKIKRRKQGRRLTQKRRIGLI